jgi:hypothetical protein
VLLNMYIACLVLCIFCVEQFQKEIILATDLAQTIPLSNGFHQSLKYENNPGN